MIALDTTAIIDIFKGDKELHSLLKKVNEPLVSTLINYQEIVFGIDDKDSRYLGEQGYYGRLFDNLLVFSLTNRSAKKASEIFWFNKKKGKTTGRFDCMIAGILLTNDVSKIITRNKHLSDIPELQVLEY